MFDMDKLLHEEHHIITALWNMEKRYISRIPLNESDWKELIAEGNELAKERKGESQDVLVGIVLAIHSEIEFLDKKIREAKENEHGG